MPTVPVRSPPLSVASVVVERPQPTLVSAATAASVPTTRTKLLRMKSSDWFCFAIAAPQREPR